MSCDSNETAFNKLRECWSRHHKIDNNMRPQCECCCSGQKTKSNVKGKFGLAYVIDTPNRKCRPCGWQIEFDDTLSEVENNCKKMMQWVTCPPLGECQNNRTNICRCSEKAKKLLQVQPPSCPCKRNDDTLCKCCKQTKKKSGGDCCCKNEQQTVSCCCNKKPMVNKNNCLCSQTNKADGTNQCCCNLGKNNNQRFSKSKPTSSCCRARNGQAKYLESVKRCVECSCIISNEEQSKQCCCKSTDDYKHEECCCNKTKQKSNCCCQGTDSQSSFDCCECEKPAGRKDCCCDCAGCKCTGETKGDKKTQKNRDKNRNDKRKEKNVAAGSKDKSKPKPSKNSHSPEPTTERHKGNEKSPFTLRTHKEPKKEPDISEEKILGDFYAGLQKRKEDIKNPEDETVEKRQDSVVNLELETETNTQNDTATSHRETKEPNQSTLLQQIKELHKNDMDLIYPNQEDKVQVANQMEVTPEKPAKKRKLHNGPSLLKKIKQERKKELEAINPKQQEQENKDKPDPAMDQTLGND